MLVLIPDHTRSLPLPELFRMVVDVQYDVRELNFMVALGTHPGYSQEGLNRLVGIAAEERATTYRHVGLLNHAWSDPSVLTSLVLIELDEIKQLAGPSYHASLPTEVNIRINKAVCEHDVVGLEHGKYIAEAGYHILPYFLADWDRYKHLPLGALAHCTHVRGSGVMENGVEKPNVRLTGSTGRPRSGECHPPRCCQSLTAELRRLSGASGKFTVLGARGQLH